MKRIEKELWQPHPEGINDAWNIKSFNDFLTFGAIIVSFDPPIPWHGAFGDAFGTIVCITARTLKVSSFGWMVTTGCSHHRVPYYCTKIFFSWSRQMRWRQAQGTPRTAGFARTMPTSSIITALPRTTPPFYLFPMLWVYPVKFAYSV